MSIPFHLFTLQSRKASAGDDDLRVPPRTDMQWDRPLFRPPSLPALRQRTEELRFDADFRAKDWTRG
jgi:hypothetical protein